MGDRMKNCVVNHIVWGQGKIQSLNERYIKVLFDNPEVGEKTFVYPDAFSKYIRYEDKEYQEQVENKLQQIRMEAEERAALEEKERRAAAEQRKNEKKLQSMKRRAIAYSRKRAERLRAKGSRTACGADMPEEAEDSDRNKSDHGKI
jgi:ATPase subunit of ABC transporter with duplicated ATPase domains